MHPKLCRYVEPRPRVWPLFALAFGFGLIAVAGVTALEMDNRMCCFSDPVGLARATAERFALEAHPQWVADHPGRALARLDELCDYVNLKVAVDPWGERYLMIPTGAAIVVGSKGPDQELGTADDIWSSQP